MPWQAENDALRDWIKNLLIEGDHLVYLAALIAALLLLWLLIRIRRQQARLTHAKVFARIAHDRLQDFVIPSVDDGEIHLENLLLTAKGLLVVDIKAVAGSVFGGDKMQDWTVINSDGRFTFSNPQPALQERVAAVRLIARDIPVLGRILFLSGASFTRGIPSMACTLEDLLNEFEEKDAGASEAKVSAFRQQWDILRDKAVATQLSQLLRRGEN